MTTLKEFMSANRDIKNEVSAAVLVSRDSASGAMTVAESTSGAIAIIDTTTTTDIDIKFSYRNIYSSTNVTTVAWVEMIAATTDDVKRVEIFDSSGETLELGIGAAGSESRKFLIPPGGISLDVVIPTGSRISLQSLSATASIGEFIANFMG